MGYILRFENAPIIWVLVNKNSDTNAENKEITNLLTNKIRELSEQKPVMEQPASSSGETKNTLTKSTEKNMQATNRRTLQDKKEAIDQATQIVINNVSENGHIEIEIEIEGQEIFQTKKGSQIHAHATKILAERAKVEADTRAEEAEEAAIAAIAAEAARVAEVEEAKRKLEELEEREAEVTEAKRKLE